MNTPIYNNTIFSLVQVIWLVNEAIWSLVRRMCWALLAEMADNDN